MMAGQSLPQAAGLEIRLQRAMALLFTIGLSALAVLEPVMAMTIDSFNPVRQAVFLLFLIFLMLLSRPRLLLSRELAIYGSFVVYMFITLIWTTSPLDGMNTLIPAVNFMLLLILFGSLIAFHDLRGVIGGALGGFLLGAVAYTKVSGFPFSYPVGFSYNAIAGIYLLGLFITLVFGWFARLRLVPLVIALITMMLIAATTSIKFNLGIAIGAAAAILFYSGAVVRVLWRNVVLMCILGAALVFAVASNGDVLERVQRGFDRVSRGVEILQRREDATGHTSFGDREDWKNQGIKGWARSPLLGNGVEAFRSDVGITSHSTPIDLLYNTGVIGLIAFYSVFMSIALRLLHARGSDLGGLPPLIFAGLVCYAFITLSGTMHYNSFMAVFFAVSGGLLRRNALHPLHAPKRAAESAS